MNGNNEQCRQKMKLENARIGYQKALDLGSLHVQTAWAIFNAMIVANSVIIASLIVLLTNKVLLTPLKILLPLLGIVICVVWLILAKRTLDHAVYYIQSCREIEENFLSDSVKVLSRGADFSQGKKIRINFKDENVVKRISFIGRVMTGRNASFVLIFAFIAIYICILFQLVKTIT